jgi:SAM-dependent methyltransferase
MDSSTWDERYRSTDLVWGAQPNQFVRRECESLPPGDALDLACGQGRNALWLARLGWRVTGIDYSPVAIGRARTLTAEEAPEVAGRLTWMVGDATQPTVEERSADLVLIAYFQLPPDDFGRMLHNAAHALRAGGTMVVVGHDRRNLTEGVAGPQDIDRLHDPAVLRAQLEELGLVVERAETVDRETDAGTALDTLVRCQRP